MTVKDLIKNKDYDYISWRMTLPEGFDEKDIFFGATRSENGKLIPLDGDVYYEDTEVLSYEEWSSVDVDHGLTVVCKGEWLSDNHG